MTLLQNPGLGGLGPFSLSAKAHALQCTRFTGPTGSTANRTEQAKMLKDPPSKRRAFSVYVGGTSERILCSGSHFVAQVPCPTGPKTQQLVNFLFLVVRPGAPSSVLAPSSDAHFHVSVPRSKRFASALQGCTAALSFLFAKNLCCAWLLCRGDLDPQNPHPSLPRPSFKMVHLFVLTS